ncbi:hypothetical protein ASC92_27700 [Variovorax sp. Root411]|nr:hypothetical protein ASC92_27700 [Variovorax sp. Root411]
MSSSSSFTSPVSFTPREVGILEALRPFLGADAEVLYGAHGRSLHRLVCHARDASTVGCLQLMSGLRLARV